MNNNDIFQILSLNLWDPLTKIKAKANEFRTKLIHFAKKSIV